MISDNSSKVMLNSLHNDVVLEPMCLRALGCYCGVSSQTNRKNADQLFSLPGVLAAKRYKLITFGDCDNDRLLQKCLCYNVLQV